jgi:hypothetical protein
VTVATGVPEPTLKVAKVAPVGVAESEDSKNAPDPKAPCPACGSGQWWQQGGAWHCRSCQPAMPLTATTLTLPCHQPPPPPLVPTHAPLDPLLEYACKGVAITAGQLRQALEDTDLQALASGELTLKALRLTAWTLVLAHHGLPDRRADQRRREPSPCCRESLPQRLAQYFLCAKNALLTNQLYQTGIEPLVTHNVTDTHQHELCCVVLAVPRLSNDAAKTKVAG